MTRSTNARIAGITFLAYIAAGIPSMIIMRRATRGDGMAARLASIAAHPGDLSIVVLLGLVQAFCAIILGVTLYALTRDEDRDLALLGMASRLTEGIIGAAGISGTLSLRWLATATGPGAPAGEASHALAAYLMRGDGALTATFFAVGSLLFSWLLLRGRMIPTVLAWIGVVASAILVVALPLQLVGLLPAALAMAIWLPMLAFEVPLALWLIVRGAGPVAGPVPQLRAE